MSEFYDENDADPNVEAWDSQFYESPSVAATNLIDARLAQREIDSYRYQDEQRVAANAAAMLAQAQAQQAEQAAGAAFAQTIDRSMTAAYGAEFHNHAPAVGQRLSADPGFAAINQSDPNAVLAYVDRTYQQIVAERDPGVAEWASIKKAGPKPYWQNSETMRALNEAKGQR